MATQAIRGIAGRPSTRSRPIAIVATSGSGNGRAIATALQLRDALRARGHQIKLGVFSSLERLRRWTVRGDTNFSLLICVGGDTSQSASAVAALRRSVPFLPVPAGFGNLFARAFGHSDRVDRLVDVLAHGRIVYADVGIRNGEMFLCHASFGLLSDIQERVEARKPPGPRWRRGMAYYRAALQLLRHTPLPALQLVVDGRVVADDAAVVMVANVETYGTWLPLTPQASPVDGLFDVFAMRRATKPRILRELLRRHLGLPGVEQGTLLYRGRHVSVAARGSARVELELIPNLLPVVVSPGTAAALAWPPSEPKAVGA